MLGRTRRSGGLVLGALLLLAGTGHTAGSGLSPDLLALLSLKSELLRSSPPVDPSDLDSIRDDALAALSNLSGSMVPYLGVPESLLGSRFGLEVANLFFHRHGSPDRAGELVTRVTNVMTAYPGAGPALAGLTSQGAALSTLPADYQAFRHATTDNDCTLPENWRNLYDVAKAYIVERLNPDYDPQDGGLVTCDPANPTGVLLISPPSGATFPTETVQVDIASGRALKR